MRKGYCSRANGYVVLASSRRQPGSDIGPTDSARFKEGLPCRGVPALDGLAFTTASKARRPPVARRACGPYCACRSSINVLISHVLISIVSYYSAVEIVSHMWRVQFLYSLFESETALELRSVHSSFTQQHVLYHRYSCARRICFAISAKSTAPPTICAVASLTSPSRAAFSAAVRRTSTAAAPPTTCAPGPAESGRLRPSGRRLEPLRSAQLHWTPWSFAGISHCS